MDERWTPKRLLKVAKPYEQAAIEELENKHQRIYLGLLGGVLLTVLAGGANFFPQGTAAGTVYRLGEETNSLTLITAGIVGASAAALLAVLLGQDWRVSPRQLYLTFGSMVAMASASLPLVLALARRIIPFVIISIILGSLGFGVYTWAHIRTTGKLPPIIRRRLNRGKTETFL